MKADYFPFGNNPEVPQNFGILQGVSNFCIETANQNRVVLLKEKYWNVMKACIIYLSYILKESFPRISCALIQIRQKKKPTRCVKMQKLALAYISHKVWMMNYKVRMLNAITTLLISLIQKGMPESRLFSAV